MSEQRGASNRKSVAGGRTVRTAGVTWTLEEYATVKAAADAAGLKVPAYLAQLALDTDGDRRGTRTQLLGLERALCQAVLDARELGVDAREQMRPVVDEIYEALARVGVRP